MYHKTNNFRYAIKRTVSKITYNFNFFQNKEIDKNRCVFFWLFFSGFEIWQIKIPSLMISGIFSALQHIDTQNSGSESENEIER